MKLLSLFLASSYAQDYASDKWVGYDYGSYGSYDHYGGSSMAKFTHETVDNGVMGRMGNGLTCWTCHGRLRMGSAEGVTNNAWLDCANTVGTGHGEKECLGDQRSCMTEERRRYDIVVEVKAGCKNPEACIYQWRRNERYMPMFHLFGDMTASGTPGFFDDECATFSTNSKHGSAGAQRSQWESTCRHCCSAVAGTGCNGPTEAADPVGHFCQGSAGCAAALDSTSGNKYASYSIDGIPTFLGTNLANNRATPGEGRNSAPEDKFVDRQDAGGTTLAEQADRLSTEDTDFHDNRQGLGAPVFGA